MIQLIILGLMALNLLFIMAILIILVAGFGITTTMSISVMERCKEIAVMKAIGASNRHILQVILAEGVLIGVISWLISILFCMPMTYFLGDTFTETMFGIPLVFVLDISAIFWWLLFVVFIALVGSYIPARKAINISVKNNLSCIV